MALQWPATRLSAVREEVELLRAALPLDDEFRWRSNGSIDAWASRVR